MEYGTGSSNEQVLLNLWASVFGQEKIGLQDDFFELGGNSLTAVRLWQALINCSVLKCPYRYLTNIARPGYGRVY